MRIPILVSLALSASAAPAVAQCVDEVLDAPVLTYGAGMGIAVAVAGDYVLAGAPYDDQVGQRCGRVEVFVTSGDGLVWTQSLTARDAQPMDEFGQALDADGECAVALSGFRGLSSPSGSGFSAATGPFPARPPLRRACVRPEKEQPSRLRRPSWLVSKERRDLDIGWAVFIAWRNPVRRSFNQDSASPSQVLGFTPRRMSEEGLCSWRQDWGRRSIHPLGSSAESIERRAGRGSTGAR